MADPSPRAYSPDAINYLEQHRDWIDSTAVILGVPATAIAGSMSREITDADDRDAAGQVAHWLAKLSLLSQTEVEDEVAFRRQILQLRANPGILDGDPFPYYSMDPIDRDVGPGAIKALTAVRLVLQYAKTPEGIKFGLDKYSANNLKAILHDLADRHSPLSISLAGLVIRDGQTFYAGKKIAGQTWDALSPEQRDAALISYYTVGEHAVRTDMAAGRFDPVEPMPKGGNVGGWTFYGDNYAKLQSALRIGQTVPSVAPKANPAPRGGRVPPKRHADIELRYRAMQNLPGMAAAARHSGRWTGRPLAGPMATVEAARAKLSWLPSAEGKRGGVQGSIAPDAAAVTARTGVPVDLMKRLVGFQPADGRVPRVALASSVMSAGRLSAAKRLTAMPALAVARRPEAASVPAGGQRTFAGLPSVAPVTRAGPSLGSADFRSVAFPSGEVDAALAGAARPPASGQADYVAPGMAAGLPGMDFGNRDELRRDIAEILNRQARLPPSGATGFDPRLTPAWAGLQLPA